MTAEADPATRPRDTLRQRLTRLVGNPTFQSWASRLPGLSTHARREGRALFSMVAGFAQSQALLALVELEVLEALYDGPATAADLAGPRGLTPDRMALLARAGMAMGLIRQTREGAFALTSRGASILGVGGVREMIRHHRILYGDLADPVAFLRGETEPALARYWPYVGGGRVEGEAAETYSRLMSESLTMVAEDTLAQGGLGSARRLLDVGAGNGAFLAAAARRHAALRLDWFDLAAVETAARAHLAAQGLAPRTAFHPGSFRDGVPRTGADAISLVRVLFDHDEATVAALVAACLDALPRGGRIVVSEPMSGGDRPHVVGDVYFALYTAAMGTGRVRSQDEVAAHLADAGFAEIRAPRPARPFVTAVVTARRP